MGRPLLLKRKRGGVTVPTERAKAEPLAHVVDVLAASPGRDQPGTRIEDHAALVAVVRREHLAQALDGTAASPSLRLARATLVS